MNAAKMLATAKSKSIENEIGNFKLINHLHMNPCSPAEYDLICIIMKVKTVPCTAAKKETFSQRQR